jgi:putative ABC transport system permease protein
MMLTDLLFRLRALFRREKVEDELDDELRFHVEQETEKYVTMGMTREEAARRVRLDFGGMEQVKEACREARGLYALEALWFDVRFATRMLRRNPGLSGIAVLTLALGIGANTAIFSVVHAVLLRPFSYPNPERLVILSERAPGLPVMYVSMADLDDWRAMNKSFESIEPYRITDVALTGLGDPQRLKLRQVSAGLFPMLGVKPILGRPFSAEDDQPNAKPVVLLSDTLWARQFGRDPAVLHKQLLFDGQASTVIGVVPSSRCHMGWRQTDAFTPLGLMGNLIGGPSHRDKHNGVAALGRLKPGITIHQVRHEMDAIAQRLDKQYPATNAGLGVNVDPLLEYIVGDARSPLLLLTGAVALVLLIACANVANLLMSQTVVRRREIAVRSALGAGAARLARQQICGSLLLALLGGAVGLLVAFGATRILGHLAAASIPRLDEVSVDGTVLLFTFGVSLLTGIVFGVLPTLMALRTDPNEVLKDSGHGSHSGLARMSLRRFLAAGELALSLVLLVCTALTIKSLLYLANADLGFQPQGVLVASLNLPGTRYPSNDIRAKFIGKLVERIATLPGVQAAGFFDLLGGSQTDFRVEGRPEPEAGNEPYVEISSITPQTLQALGVELLQGRHFNSKDVGTAPRVCIIDDALANRYWPGGSAVGKRVDFDLAAAPRGWWKVVGVVHHLQLYGAAEKAALPIVFFPFQQYPHSSGRVLVRSDEDKSTLEPMMRGVLYSLDPDLPLYNVLPMAELTDTYVAPQRLLATLLSVFAGIALFLATVGAYGVMAYMVAGRASEIGVRRALGATPRDILQLVLNQGVWLATTGLVVGVIISLALGRFITPMLFGVKANDPMIFASAGAGLMVLAMTVSLIPAQRAMRLNQLEALRHE